MPDGGPADAANLRPLLAGVAGQPDGGAEQVADGHHADHLAVVLGQHRQRAAFELEHRGGDLVDVSVEMDRGGRRRHVVGGGGVPGAAPSAIALVRSRSVKIPTNRPPTVTTTEPTCSFYMRSAASVRQSSPSTRTTQGRKIDLTFMALPSRCGVACRAFTLRRRPRRTQGLTALARWAGCPAGGAVLRPAGWPPGRPVEVGPDRPTAWSGWPPMVPRA